MKYFYRLDPGCECELGNRSKIDFNKPFLQQTEFLHLHINGSFEADLSFLGDCWVVTEGFKTLIIEEKISGCIFLNMATTCDKELEVLYPEIFPLPQLWRMVVTGKAFVDDIGLKNYEIIASESFIEALNRLRYNHYATTVEVGGDAAEKLISHRRSNYW